MNTEYTYEKALAEALKTIDCLELEEREKISKKFLELLKENMDKEYYDILIIDDYFVENKLGTEAKEILALVYRDYIADDKERAELFEKESEEERKYQEELREKYNPDNLFNKKAQVISKPVEENKQLVKVEDLKWYQKFYKKILEILKFKK